MPTVESTRVAGQMAVTEQTFGMTAVSQTFASADATRKKIILCPPAAGSYTVSIKTPAVLGEGITVTAGQNPVVVDEESWGNTPQKQLFAIGSGAFNVCNYRVVSTAG
jgi:hypothetical protein